MDTQWIGKNVCREKEEYDNCDSGYHIIEDHIIPITLAQQNKLKAIFEILKISVPRIFGETEITIRTKELNTDEVYKLFSKKKENSK